MAEQRLKIDSSVYNRYGEINPGLALDYHIYFTEELNDIVESLTKDLQKVLGREFYDILSLTNSDNEMIVTEANKESIPFVQYDINSTILHVYVTEMMANYLNIVRNKNGVVDLYFNFYEIDFILKNNVLMKTYTAQRDANLDRINIIQDSLDGASAKHDDLLGRAESLEKYPWAIQWAVNMYNDHLKRKRHSIVEDIDEMTKMLTPLRENDEKISEYIIRLQNLIKYFEFLTTYKSVQIIGQRLATFFKDDKDNYNVHIIREKSDYEEYGMFDSRGIELVENFMMEGGCEQC